MKKEYLINLFELLETEVPDSVGLMLTKVSWIITPMTPAGGMAMLSGRFIYP